MVDSVTFGSVLKNACKFVGIAFIAAIVFFMPACIASAQTINSAVALKEYLDKQPANSPDKPIKVTMSINDPMLKGIVAAIKSAGKYVSLNLSGNALTTIPDRAFYGCEMLAAITIPNSVTSIGERAFFGCTSLTSVTFDGTELAGTIYVYNEFGFSLLELFDSPGTYTRPSSNSDTWTKK
jgi:hypothetical protein